MVNQYQLKMISMCQKPSKDQIDNLIKMALNEDIGPGDITTRSIVNTDQIYTAEFLVRSNIVLCGLDILKAVFLHLDSNICYSANSFNDGDWSIPITRLHRVC